MNILKGTREEKLAQIQRMTNAELFIIFHFATLSRAEMGDDIAWAYAEISAQLEKRLQRVGFLPDNETLSEIRKKLY